MGLLKGFCTIDKQNICIGVQCEISRKSESYLKNCPIKTNDMEWCTYYVFSGKKKRRVDCEQCYVKHAVVMRILVIPVESDSEIRQDNFMFCTFADLAPLCFKSLFFFQSTVTWMTSPLQCSFFSLFLWVGRGLPECVGRNVAPSQNGLVFNFYVIWKTETVGWLSLVNMVNSLTAKLDVLDYLVGFQWYWWCNPFYSTEKYFKLIAYDYREVAIETGQSMKARPIRSGLILSSLGGWIYLTKTNPSESAFHSQLVEHRLDLLLVGSPIRNPESDEHLNHIAECYNAGLLRRFTFGICSIIWLDRFDPKVDMYEARCKDMKVGWVEMFNRVVDFGIHNRWRFLDMAMMDYDINPGEWPEEKEMESKWRRYLKSLLSSKTWQILIVLEMSFIL